MKYRTLKNGQRVAEAPERVSMTINSKCPKKWAFVDMETGDIWVHKVRLPNGKKRPYTFYAADKKALKIVRGIMRERTEYV
jgi:hypothetical protein